MQLAKYGPIVIIEDNEDERFLYQVTFRNLKVSNPLSFFNNGREALDYLASTQENPFLIICDIQMPVMDGLELRQRVVDNPYLVKKATPFVFRTGNTTSFEIAKAYELTVQGFFKKSHDPEKMGYQLKLILDYWKECLEPNDDV
ncbi:hypothetical protein BH11BAC7_BH11BAC7_26500 [soil metagenome]